MYRAHESPSKKIERKFKDVDVSTALKKSFSLSLYFILVAEIRAMLDPEKLEEKIILVSILIY